MSWDIAAGQAIIEQLNYKVNILQLNDASHIAKNIYLIIIKIISTHLLLIEKMVKILVLIAIFSGTKHKVDFYVGNPAEKSLYHFQSKWLAENRHGHIPEDLMNTFSQINDISTQNKVPFEDLANILAMKNKEKDRCVEDYNAASEFSGNQYLEQDLEADDERMKNFKPSKKSKMQKGSAIGAAGCKSIKTRANSARKILQQFKVRTPLLILVEKSFKAQNPTIIEENGIKKPKRKKGRSPN